MNHLDQMEFRKSGKWGEFLFPEELSEIGHELNVTVMLLTSRVCVMTKFGIWLLRSELIQTVSGFALLARRKQRH